MKPSKLTALFLVAVALSACDHQPAAPHGVIIHPTDEEMQDFKDGQAFAQERYGKADAKHADPTAMAAFAASFSSEGALINDSSYFDLGAYYQEYGIFITWSRNYVETYKGKVDDVTIQLVKTIRRTPWLDFADNFKKSGLSYEQLSKLTGKPLDDLQPLVDNEPDREW